MAFRNSEFLQLEPSKWVTHFVVGFCLGAVVSRRFVAFMEFLFIAFSRFAVSLCWSPQPHMFVLQAFGVRYLESFCEYGPLASQQATFVHYDIWLWCWYTKLLVRS